MGAPQLGSRQERDAFQKKVKAMRDSGLSYSEIGKEVGMTSSTIGYYLTARDKRMKKKAKQHRTAMKHSRNGVVSVLGAPTESGSEATGFAAGFLSAWLKGYANRHQLDADSLTLDVVNILRKEVR